ncbi:MAG: 30S ribosomal protein S5 [Candidatus Colwellbacteria bacterium CG_4_9_14_0_2_um_filter_50_12]|uniref:Small ribosomal subunit protein uS5 n=1 Tax=Candidatus Colwellbacteria bacterium CG_4_9_14_0_2_um_filter_50_12 TaxID=1974538 RepID=A0A2M8G141_9BACT|nr:MAG: 30S ribosomal protein S5 [Candidatus Colwellbacteria bacterium CG_4_9_14_0_2_um_filter_50_12]
MAREFRNALKDEFKDRVLEIRRVTRVIAGGKRFRFRSTIVVGDMKGRIGVGMGKSIDLQQAIQKARHNAKKNVVKIVLHGGTIPHEVLAKFSAAKVILKPAREGHGLMAGGAVRIVLKLAGVRDATAKCLGTTTNKLTTAMATVEALKMLRPEKKVKTLNDAAAPVTS